MKISRWLTAWALLACAPLFAQTYNFFPPPGYNCSAGPPAQIPFASTANKLLCNSSLTYSSSSDTLQLGAPLVPGTFSVGTCAAMTISGAALSVPTFCANSNIQGNVEVHSFTSSSPAAGSFLYGVRARNTITTPAAVVSGDNLLTLGGAGFDGTGYTWGAHIHFLADGTPSAGVLPGALDFQTTPSGSNTPVSRLLLDHSGAFLVNGSAGSSGQFLSSAGAGAAAAWATLPGGFTGFANPTASLGLTAVNGSATTAMRSDAAPPLDQSIAPTMTGLWNFTHTGATTPAPVTINSSLNMLELHTTRTRGTGGDYIRYTDPTGQKGCVGFCSSGSDDFYIENDLASATHIYSNGIDRIGLDQNGGIFMNQPTGGTVNTLLINLPVGQYGLLVGSNSITAGNSFGEEIQAGTNTTDNSFAVINQAATLTYFRIRGDGEIFGGGPVAAAQVDMTPDTSTFTATYTGMTASTTCTASWVRMGLHAILTLCAATGTSNATTFTMTGLPAAMQPATVTQQVVPLSQPAVTNNGAGAASPVDVVITNGSGTLTFRLNGGTASWTNANSKGFANALTIAYSLK